MIAPVDFDQHSSRRGLPRVLPSDPQDGRETGSSTTTRAMEVVRDAIGNHPTVAILAGASLGLVAAWLVKRRGN